MTALSEVTESKIWDKCNIDVSRSSAMAKAEKEQSDFEVKILNSQLPIKHIL